jgi:hypothetical protein
VTTEVCVNITVREANDRGFRCIVLPDCCASYFPKFHQCRLRRPFCIAAKRGFVGLDLTQEALKAPFYRNLLVVPRNNLR